VTRPAPLIVHAEGNRFARRRRANAFLPAPSRTVTTLSSIPTLPGVGLEVGAAVGAGIGAVSGHLKNGMSNSDLKELGAVLDQGQAGLIVSPTRSTPTRTSSPSS
jgi:Protein of unknown function (DUF1269)